MGVRTSKKISENIGYEQYQHHDYMHNRKKKIGTKEEGNFFNKNEGGWLLLEGGGIKRKEKFMYIFLIFCFYQIQSH